MSRTHLVLASAFSVAACAGPRPPVPVSAAVSVPTEWRDKRDSYASEPASQWWGEFNDPALSAVVQQTLARNMDIAIAVTRIDQARAELRLARSQQGPDISVGAGGGPQRALDAFGEARNQTAGQAQLAVAYDTDLFGRLANSTAAARASLLATEAARDSVELALASTAASAYLTLRALDARLAILRATVRARTEIVRQLRRRVESGYAPSLDQRQAEAELRAAEALIPATELAIRRQENALSLLMGGEPAAIDRGAPWDAISLPPTAAGVPSSLLRRRPDIFQAEQTLVASDRALDSARAAFLPSVRINAAGGVLAATTLADPVSIFSLGGSILAPLFSSGRLEAQSDAAAARRDQAAFAYRRTVLTAFREVEDALAAIDRGAEQELRLREQQSALVEVLRVATNRYRVGYSPYLEQLDAQRTLLAADLSLIQVRSERMLAHVQLFQALGGGWQQPEQ